MSKSILYYFTNLILGNGYQRELDNFKFLLRSENRDFSQKYDEDEKIIYMYDRIPYGFDDFIIDGQSSHPVRFRSKLKSKVISQYKIVEEKLSGKWETIEHLQNKQVFLDKQYHDLIRMQEKLKKSKELSSYKFIKAYLEKLRLHVEELYGISKLNPPKELSLPHLYKRKKYKEDLPSQDEIVAIVQTLSKSPRFVKPNGQLKPTTLRDQLLKQNTIKGINNISERALFDRVKDAIEEIAFYEADSAS